MKANVLPYAFPLENMTPAHNGEMDKKLPPTLSGSGQMDHERDHERDHEKGP